MPILFNREYVYAVANQLITLAPPCVRTALDSESELPYIHCILCHCDQVAYASASNLRVWTLLAAPCYREFYLGVCRQPFHEIAKRNMPHDASQLLLLNVNPVVLRFHDP